MAPDGAELVPLGSTGPFGKIKIFYPNGRGGSFQGTRDTATWPGDRWPRNSRRALGEPYQAAA
jgi:hypothetical protein